MNGLLSKTVICYLRMGILVARMNFGNTEELQNGIQDGVFTKKNNTEMTRIKRVFTDVSEIAHLWAKCGHKYAGSYNAKSAHR